MKKFLLAVCMVCSFRLFADSASDHLRSIADERKAAYRQETEEERLARHERQSEEAHERQTAEHQSGWRYIAELAAWIIADGRQPPED